MFMIKVLFNLLKTHTTSVSHEDLRSVSLRSSSWHWCLAANIHLTSSCSSREDIISYRKTRDCWDECTPNAATRICGSKMYVFINTSVYLCECVFMSLWYKHCCWKQNLKMPWGAEGKSWAPHDPSWLAGAQLCCPGHLPARGQICP